MEAQKHAVPFDLNATINQELPYVSAYYSSAGELQQDVKDLLAFPIANHQAMPFYTLRHSSCEPIADAFYSAYEAMIYALERLFGDDAASLAVFFDCDLIRKHGRTFIPYARHTFQSRTLIGQALYGRFDAALDPVSERITGIYEFNGDTPVMLFESINLQHSLLCSIDADGQNQFNEWYQNTVNMLRTHRLEHDHQIAIACSMEYIEDIATCETLAQVIGEQAGAHLLDLKDIDYDHANLEQPFVIRGTDTYLDALFVLSPWEEMVEAFPAAFAQWERWADNVALLEPAWRWFLSHKGMLAYLTHLSETDSVFRLRFKGAPLLRTYLTPERFQQAGQAYVSKPVLGRLSSNIEIVEANGQVSTSSEGHYGDCERVYQEYHTPHCVPGRNNFIVGMWMSGQARTKLALPATLCIREFDAPVLELSNERFIPHVLVQG